MLVSFPIGFFGTSGLILSVQNISVQIASSGTTANLTVNSVDTTAASLSYSGENEANTTSQAGDKAAGFMQLTSATNIACTRQTAEAFTLTMNGSLVNWNKAAVKSVQYGSAALTGTNTTAAATISSITTTNAAIMLNGWTLTTGTTTSSQVMRCDVTITGATGAQVKRDTGNASFLPTAYFCVLEFAAGILNSATQQVVNLFTGATSNSTITSVTTAQAASFWGGYTNTSSGSVFTGSVYGTLAGATTFTFNKLAGTFNTEAVASIVEFKTSDIKSLNRGTNTIASGSGSQATTITSTVTGKTMVHQQGYGVGSAIADPDMALPKTTQASATSIQSSRVTTAAGSTSIAPFEAVEFN